MTHFGNLSHRTQYLSSDHRPTTTAPRPPQQRPPATGGNTDRSALLDAVLATAAEGVWVLDRDGRTVLASDRMAQLLAVAPSRLASGSVAQLLDPSAARLITAQLELCAAGVKRSYEVAVTRLDGQRRTFGVSTAPRYDDAGGYIGAVVLCADVTELAELRARVTGDPGELGGVDAYIASRIAEHLQGGAAEPAPPEVPGLNLLSNRETEVVRMLLAGDRVPAIARALFVSQSTVRNHLSSVFRKLRVGSQQELVLLFRRSNNPARPSSRISA